MSLGAPQSYGFGDVGYNFMIGSDGTIYEGRPLQYEAAHVGGHNAGNVGVAFLGDYSSKPLSDAQLAAAHSLITRLNDVYGIPARNANSNNYIYSHGQFDTKRQSELAGAATQIEALKQSIYGR